jgi:phosphoglycolate phosphatase
MHISLLDKEFFAGIRGFIFDCDGVLVDSMAANMAYYNIFREHFGLPPMSREEELYVHSASNQESLDRILPAEFRAEAEEFRKTLDYRMVLPWLQLETGLTELLTWLSGKGFHMGVNTNRTNTMDMLLEHFGLSGIFDPVIQASCVSRPKPSPEGVLAILDGWRMLPGEAVFIGDSHVDEQTARAAGVRFWAYRNESLLAELHLSDYAELSACLKRVDAL